MLIVDAVSIPTYLEIRHKAAQLSELGMSDRAIARALDISDKTARKAINSLADRAGLPGGT